MAKKKKSSRRASPKKVKRSFRKASGSSGTRKLSRPSGAPKKIRRVKARKLPQKDLEFYKKLLLQLRAKIAGKLQQIEGDSLSVTQPSHTGELSDVADMATDNYDRELSIGLASNEQRILNDIDVALKRIEEGTYGICEVYGTPIPKKRLVAMPYTRLSMQAQEEQEKNKRYP